MDDATEAKHLFEPTGDFQCLHEFIPAARAKLVTQWYEGGDPRTYTPR